MMNHDSASSTDIRMSVEGKEVVVTAQGNFEKGTPFVGKYVKVTPCSLENGCMACMRAFGR